MSNLGRGREQDRARLAGNQDHEVRYEAGKESVSEDLVKDTIKGIGNSRQKIENKLDRKK